MADLNIDELPQEKWKREKFESQYVPNYEMSKGSKKYERLHNIRSGMETLPLTLGTNMIGNAINTVASLGGSVLPKYRNVPSTINPSDTSFENLYQWFDDLGNDSKNFQLVDVLDGYDKDDDWYKEWQTTIEGDKYLNAHKKDRKTNTFKKNFNSNKKAYNSLNKIFRKALGVADIAGKAATSNLAGSLINNLETNWYEPSAKKIYNNIKNYLSDEANEMIELEGLTPENWYKYIDPEIALIDAPRYETSLSNDEISNIYARNQIHTEIPEKPEFWDSMDDKAKLKNIEGFRKLKKQSRKNPALNDIEDILYERKK